MSEYTIVKVIDKNGIIQSRRININNFQYYKPSKKGKRFLGHYEKLKQTQIKTIKRKRTELRKRELKRIKKDVKKQIKAERKRLQKERKLYNYETSHHRGIKKKTRFKVFFYTGIPNDEITEIKKFLKVKLKGMHKKHNRNYGIYYFRIYYKILFNAPINISKKGKPKYENHDDGSISSSISRNFNEQINQIDNIIDYLVGLVSFGGSPIEIETTFLEYVNYSFKSEL